MPAEILTWLQVTLAVVGILTSIIGGIWGYTRFVLERGLFPPAEFTVQCNLIGTHPCKLFGAQSECHLLEILLEIKNKGNTVLVASNIAAKVRYLEANAPVGVLSDPTKPAFGRTEFPHSLGKKLRVEHDPSLQHAGSAIPVVPANTFVKPGIDQIYTLVTSIPATATFVLIKGEFTYAARPTRLQRLVLKVSRVLGFTQYTLDNVTEPHTAERVFKISTNH